MERKGCLQVFQLPTEGIGEASKPAHTHSHRQILTLNVASRNMGLVTIPRDHSALHTCHLCRGTTAGSDRLGIVEYSRFCPHERDS
jgi:hypothetical protein